MGERVRTKDQADLVVTANGNLSFGDLHPETHEMALYVRRKAFGGTTPTLTFQPQVSYDGGSNWVNFGASKALNDTTGVEALFRFGDNTDDDGPVLVADKYRLNMVIAGASATFTIDVFRHEMRRS